MKVTLTVKVHDCFVAAQRTLFISLVKQTYWSS